MNDLTKPLLDGSEGVTLGDLPPPHPWQAHMSGPFGASAWRVARLAPEGPYALLLTSCSWENGTPISFTSAAEAARLAHILNDDVLYLGPSPASTAAHRWQE